MDAREQELSAQFLSIKATLANWGAFVDKRIIELIAPAYEGSNFIQMRPNHRCKNEQSFIKKSLYRGKDYKNPIVEIEDKVATRIVLLTSENVYTVKALLTACNDWTTKVSKDTREISKDNPNLFDYQSVHLVVWPKLPFENVDSSLLSCEIQIRTLLQHAYAEVTHDSVYKGPHQNDNDIKRQLSKCMALMETTDDMFCNIFERISLTSNTGNNEYKELLIKVTALYNNIAGTNLDYKSADIDFAEIVFSLVNLKPVTFESIKEYAESGFYVDHIKHAIATNRSLLIKEPVILILFYYIENYEDFTATHWPLSMHVLEDLVESLGISGGFY